MKTIKYGSRGDEVATLQTLLHSPHNINKEFEATTHDAVVNFQRRNGLEADGIVGYRTWEKIFFNEPRPQFGITENDYKFAAMLLDCEAAALKAVQKVETGHRGGFLYGGRPVILFEGHIFWQQLRQRGINPELVVKGNEDILYPKWTKTHYIGGEKEYTRLLRARQINEDAANASASWGMFQVMGFNYSACGSRNINDFVEDMSQSECRQLLLTVRFIHGNKPLLAALQTKEWKSFARLYNGPAYAQNKYDEKLQKAYYQFAK